MISKGPLGDALAPRPAASLASSRSYSTRGRSEERYSNIPSSYPLLGLRSPSTIRDRWAREHQYQAKADPEPTRVSHATGPSEFASILGGYVDPPFDLNRLTELLFESDTYYAIVDQFAIDTASGWKLIDKEEGEEAGLPQNEVQQSLLRMMTERTLDLMCRDFDDQRISLATFSQLLLKDRDSTGNAHIEIVRDQAGKPAQYVHVPARLVRRGIDGRTFVQIDEEGRPQAFFRRYGAEVRPIDLATGKSDTPWAYLDKEEASIVMASIPPGEPAGEGQRFLDLKRELVDFKIYHPAERYYGIPPIVAAFNSLVGNILASNRNVRFFINRGMPDYAVLIKAPADAFKDPDIEQNIISRIEATIEEHMKYMIEGEDHRTLTLRCLTGDFEVEFKELGGEPSDQEWGGYQETNRDNIIHVYRMLPSKIGIIESASLGTGSGESQDETYKRSQIEPRQLMLETFWDLQLAELGVRTLEFRYDDIDVLDEQREAATLVAIASTGALSINDIRAWASRIVRDQDFPPEEELEGADVPIKLLDLQIAGLEVGGAGEPLPASSSPRPGGARGMLAALAGLANGGRSATEPPSAADSLNRIRAGTGSIQNGARRALDRRRLLPAQAENGNGRR